MASLLFLIPLFLLLLLNLPIKKVMRASAFWLAFFFLVFQLVSSLFPRIILAEPALRGFSSIFNFSFTVDALTRMLLLSIGIVSFSVLILLRGVSTNLEKRFNYINVLLIAVAGMNGIVLVKDIFSLYVFLEVTAVSTFILISFKKHKVNLEGALKYLVFSSVATIMMLASIALTILFTGDTSFASIHNAIAINHANPLMQFVIALYICGFMIKSGLFPFHGWLPDAYMAAPDTASILLAGIVTKAVGVYPLIRLVYSVIGFSGPIKDVLLFFGALSAVAGAFAALTQTDMKRMLAYSSISQVGYIILSFGCGTILGMAASIFHFFNHSIFKSILFANAAAVYDKTSTYDMDELGGLAQKMPVTGITSALACLSVSGIPPLSGFWSKVMIVIALWMSGNRFYAVIAVLTSIVTLAYMLTLQRKIFFGNTVKGLENISEAAIGIILPAVFLTVIMIIISLAFPLFIGTYLIPTGGM